MSMLFYINKRSNVAIHPDALKLYPAFKRMPLEEMNFMILYCDYHSPLHQFPPKEREQKAKRLVWGTGKHELSREMKKHMESYMELQYDPKREMIRAYQSKMETLKKELLTENDTAKVKNMVSVIKLLESECDALQSKIDFEEDQLTIEGGKKLSFLETLQHNKRLAKMKDNDYPDIEILYEPAETGNETTVTDYSIGKTDSKK